MQQENEGIKEWSELNFRVLIQRKKLGLDRIEVTCTVIQSKTNIHVETILHVNELTKLWIYITCV